MRFIKFTLPANTLFYPLYAHIWYPICFGHSSESLFVCIIESSILLKWSMDGQHIIKQILGMMCLVINYNLVKKISKILTIKFEGFLYLIQSCPSQINCIYYSQRWSWSFTLKKIIYLLTIQLRSLRIFILFQNDILETSRSLWP